jgi:hypothetical protein
MGHRDGLFLMADHGLTDGGAFGAGWRRREEGRSPCVPTVVIGALADALGVRAKPCAPVAERHQGWHLRAW